MADDYARSIARVVVGQLAEQAGYESVQETAIDVLSELLLRYLEELSAGSHAYAELATRSEINAHDALLAIEDIGGTTVDDLAKYLGSMSSVSDDLPGYPSPCAHACMHACSIAVPVCTPCLAACLECEFPWLEGRLPNMHATVTSLQEENAFAHMLAPFPVRRPARSMPTFEERGEAPPPHVPSFLPAFPDPHTYERTPVFAGHEENPEKQTQVRGASWWDEALTQRCRGRPSDISMLFDVMMKSPLSHFPPARTPRRLLSSNAALQSGR